LSEIELVFVRHGLVEGIDPERFRGRTDVPLTPPGEAQAAAAARLVTEHWRPAAIYTSPLRRCVVTGAAIARACAVAPKVLDSLVDVNYGAWQWKTPDEVRSRWPELLDRWYRTPELVRFPGGESLQDVAVRTADAVRFALEYHRGQTVVFVTHDTVIRVAIAQVLGLPLSRFWAFAPAPGSVTSMRCAERGWGLVRLGETGG